MDSRIEGADRDAGFASRYYEQAKESAGFKSAILLARAVCADPGEGLYARDLAAALARLSSIGFDADLKEAVRLLLDSPHVAPQSLVQTWRGLLTLDTRTREFLALQSCNDYDEYATKLVDVAGRTAVDDPLFLAGLRRLLVANRAFERFLTHLRRFLLTDDTARIPVPAATTVAAALAQYCHYTGYVFRISDEETAAVAALRVAIEHAEDLASRRHELCLWGCYEPIHLSARADEILTIFGQDVVLGSMATELIAKPLEERKIATAIQPLATIEEESSRRVQQQYVEFPFPRWRVADVDMTAVRGYVEAMQHQVRDILVAGCGTGLEALCYSLAFPNARILAVDLSQASLAYAIRQTDEHEVHNIDFQQADILALPHALNQQFDIVSSSGVLHHMEDPERGFHALCHLLKPGGSMFICLYSALARRYIVKAQQAVAAHAYPGTDEGIRTFRADCSRLLAEEDLERITRTTDFYTMAQCRDLLFNVIEHRFDVPRLKALLERAGLEFVGFAVEEEARRQYTAMFPDDPRATNLANWERFEAAYPDTFVRMYKFICRSTSE